MNRHVKPHVKSAMLAALCCAATLISIPLPEMCIRDSSRIEGSLGIYDHDRTQRAKAEAARLDYLDLVLKAVCLELFCQCFSELSLIHISADKQCTEYDCRCEQLNVVLSEAPQRIQLVISGELFAEQVEGLSRRSYKV